MGTGVAPASSAPNRVIISLKFLKSNYFFKKQKIRQNLTKYDFKKEKFEHTFSKGRP